MLAACSASLQGPPAFDQTYGVVDEPCAPSKATVSHCTAHVFLVNRGGEGLGEGTIVVPLQSSSLTASAARTISTVKCHASIPDTPAGGYADLICNFDLPVGKTVATVPSLESLDFVAAANSSSSGGSTTGTATLFLAVGAAILALIALVLAIARRGPSVARRGGPPTTRGSRREPDEEAGGTW